MDAAVGLALAAGVAWALNMVALRWGMTRTGVSSLVGACLASSSATVVATGLAFVLSPRSTGLDGSAIWRFAIVGAIAPGSSQGLFLASLRRLGTSRAGVLIGTAPMFSVIIAILLLGEQWKLVLLVGTALTVLGGVLLTWESGQRFAVVGSAFAVMTAMTFAVRDVVARKFTTDLDVEVVWAAVVVLASASTVLALMSLVAHRASIVSEVRRGVPEMFAAGACIGFGMPLLLLAFERGRVGVVAPLSNGAQTLTVVVVGSLMFGPRERAPRVVAAVMLVVTGATLIGAFR